MSKFNFNDIALKIAKQKGLSNIKFCGKGSFKETYYAFSDEFNSVALKIIDPNKSSLLRTAREFNAMRICDSPFKRSHSNRYRRHTG